MAGGPQGDAPYCHRGRGEEEYHRGREEEGLREVMSHVHHQRVPMAREVMCALGDGRMSYFDFLHWGLSSLNHRAFPSFAALTQTHTS